MAKDFFGTKYGHTRNLLLTLVENFVFYIASDFVDRLEEEMEESGLSKGELARKLDVSAGRVSQIFHNPGNLTLEMIVRCARAVGIKVAVLAYNDGDKENLNGPIIPEVFYECWNRCGKPKDTPPGRPAYAARAAL